MNLIEKKCVPHKGDVRPLAGEQLERYMELLSEDWALIDDDKLITAEYEFEDFDSAADFVKMISDLARSECHYPDIAFGFGYCTIALQTHEIDGLHENDFILAAKIEELANS